MVEQKDTRKARHLDRVFQALADPTRRAMLRELAAGARTVTDLAAPHRMSLAAVSKHLKVLEKAQLIRRKVRGRTHQLRLHPQAMTVAMDWLRFYERFWNERLDALEHLLDDQSENP